MKKAARININLIPKDPFLSSPIGRFLRWALSVGRYLVIFTELIVIISFATRFSLDRQITDLNTAIHQKQAIITSFGDLEQQVQAVQKKIDNFTQIEQQVNIADTLPALSEITPRDVSLTELNITPSHVIFGGSAQSSQSLDLLINNIQLSDKFSDVTVEKIQTGDSRAPGFAFRIQANVRIHSTSRSQTQPTGPSANQSATQAAQ